MRRFEGKAHMGPDFVTILMYEFDPAARTLHVYPVRGERSSHPLSQIAHSLPGQNAELFVLINDQLTDPARPWLHLFGKQIQGATPGVSEMMLTRRCERADFTPFLGHVVDLTEADLSGVVFGEVDFTPAVLTRTKFAYATINRCRFGPTQLAGLDLSHAQLAGADLRGFDLTGTIFDGAVLTDAKLGGATLERASFRGARLDGTDLQGANAARAVFDEVRGIGTRFVGATLANATFVGAKLGQAAFAGAVLTDVSFKDATLAQADFSAQADGTPAANLSGVDFDNADLQAADFSATTLTDCKVPRRLPRLGRGVDRRTRFVGATLDGRLLGSDWSYIDATDANITLDASIDGAPFRAVEAILPKIGFAGHDLVEADFTRAQLQETRFGNCILRDAKFHRASLQGADFTGANLEGAYFNYANLRSCVFAQAWMLDVKFEHSVLARTNFSSAMLAEANFTGIQGRSLAGVNFARACLVSADFRDVEAPRDETTRTTFSAACLAGADFSDATLGDVILTGAQLSAGNGCIVVTHPRRTSETRFEYEPTKVPPGATGPDTTCPDGRRGQCSPARLTSKPVPDRWSP